MAATITAATVAIMSTDDPVARRLPVVAYVTLALALVMVLLGAQRAIAYSYMAFVSEGVGDALNTDQSISAEKLDQAAIALQKAILVLPAASSLHQVLGRVEQRRASLEGVGSDEPIARRHLAAREFDKSIAAAPARALPWALAAQARELLAEPVHSIIPYLRYSYFLGPQEASNILSRTEVIVTHWSVMPDDIRQNARRDLKQLWLYPDLQYAFIDRYLRASLELRSLMLRDSMLSAGDKRNFDHQIRKAVGL